MINALKQAQMSIVQLKSDNKDFSFIIKKNPGTGLLAKNLKQGVVFGFFTKGNEQCYNIYFKDGSDEVSFPAYEGETFEYLNTSRYNSASFVVNAIDEMFRSAFKVDEYTSEEGDKKDEGGAESAFFINMIYISNERYISAFEDYFPGFTVKAEVVSGKNYQVTITTKKSIYELLNFASLFAIFQAIVNKEPMFVNEENASKYIRCMNILDAPYFVRYLFKIRFLENFKLFKGVSEELSKNRKNEITMTLGNTWQARQMAIQDRLEFNNNILDVGCGEGKYITRFNRFMKDKEYFAVDIDPAERAKAEKRVNQKSMKNVSFFDNVEQFLSTEHNNDEQKIDVICTEVVEHMPIKDAGLLIADICKANVGTLIVTTPDVRFNDNYFMEGMRHDDHDWEPTKLEFQEFMSKCLGNSEKEYTSEWFGIGDIVDGVSPSQGMIIKFK
jgi:2-polyprenyl-3-methyl-5-hydroxy-6-metoxy-1,4-benzoquinol methylase/exosome complex RNA-binding protein Csl4